MHADTDTGAFNLQEAATNLEYCHTSESPTVSGTFEEAKAALLACLNHVPLSLVDSKQISFGQGPLS
jgi:hypothetical protein